MKASITIRMNAAQNDVTVRDKGKTVVFDRNVMAPVERKKLARLITQAWRQQHGA